MSSRARTTLLGVTLLVAFGATAACTSLGVAPRPAPTRAPAPPESSPLPEPPPATLPPSLSRPAPEPERDVAARRPQSDATAASGALLEQSR
ncbi:MAG TPA: hypothetical protein VKA43_00310, partial [Gammaproteobacteria bacterium]|nr:hypothetical protein [Gammaproteobacteria bacterium]